MTYLLDSNVFIQAKNEHYGMDVCPGFWDWLVASNVAGVVASVSLVGQELKTGHDQLAQWSAQRGNEFFLEPDTSVFSAMRRIGAWLTAQQFTAGARNKFAESAHHILIARALAKEMTVVTHEKRANSQKRIKIPDVCNQFGVQCLTPLEMLRVEKVRLVLS